MKKQMPLRTWAALWLCAAMLLGCIAALGAYLGPVIQRTETKGDAFGMMLLDIADEETADSYHVLDHGVYVLAVREKSPAHLAGIASGDLLLSVKTARVPDTNAFVAMQQTFVPGEMIEMHFKRGAHENTYAVTLAWNEE